MDGLFSTGILSPETGDLGFFGTRNLNHIGMMITRAAMEVMIKGVLGENVSHSLDPSQGARSDTNPMLLENTPENVPNSFLGTTFEIRD